jgi:ketosteroid isomerase-like protein
MSQENVEIVRAMWEPFKGLDTTAIDWDTAIREIGQPISPEVEMRWSATDPEGARVYRGREGVAQAFREWVEPFSEYHSEPLDYIGVGDSVVVPTRQWGIGRASGAPVESENTHVYEFRGNQIARVDEYDTLEEALEAVGPSVQEAHADS